jgi:hypothetical protein
MPLSVHGFVDFAKDQLPDSGSWLCRASLCSPPPNAFTTAGLAPPRRWSTGRGGWSCRFTAGCPIAASSSSPTALLSLSRGAALEFLAAVRRHVCVITRLRLSLSKPRRQPVCPGPGQTPQARTIAAQRTTAAQTGPAPARSRHALAPAHRRALVWADPASGRNRQRHSHLVSRRQAPGADPLAAGARSRRQTRTPGLSRRRSRCRPERVAPLARRPLAARSHS